MCAWCQYLYQDFTPGKTPTDKLVFFRTSVEGWGGDTHAQIVFSKLVNFDLKVSIFVCLLERKKSIISIKITIIIIISIISNHHYYFWSLKMNVLWKEWTLWTLCLWFPHNWSWARMAQFAGNPQSLTWSRISSSKCECWDFRDIRD